ncbi:MAG: hypothetical protein HY747_05990 [Elusimicrobia bacterium]|nr:hypothetical protein [Elusimicrobiota bacterium]
MPNFPYRLLVTISGTFPAGYRFWTLAGDLNFIVPSPGLYSILIDFEDSSLLTIKGLPYRYDFEAKGEIEGLLGQHVIAHIQEEDQRSKTG